MNRNYYPPQEKVQEPISAKQRIGEDIRAAKFLYGWIHGIDPDEEPIDVNQWLREAKALMKEMRANTLQGAFKLVNRIPEDILIKVK